MTSKEKVFVKRTVIKGQKDIFEAWGEKDMKYIICECGNPSGDVKFFDKENQCPCGLKRHHWHCADCGKIRECNCGNPSGDVAFVNTKECNCGFHRYHWHCKDCGKLLEEIRIPINGKLITIRRGIYEHDQFAPDDPKCLKYRTGYCIYCGERYYEYHEFIEILANLTKDNKIEDICQFVLEIFSYKYVYEPDILYKNYMEKYLRKICDVATFWFDRNDDRVIRIDTKEDLERIACYLACLFIAEENYLYYDNTKDDPGALFYLDAIRQVLVEGIDSKTAVDRNKKARGQQKEIRKNLKMW